MRDIGKHVYAVKFSFEFYGGHLLLWIGTLAALFTGSPLSPSSDSISRASRLSYRKEENKKRAYGEGGREKESVTVRDHA